MAKFPASLYGLMLLTEKNSVSESTAVELWLKLGSTDATPGQKDGGSGGTACVLLTNGEFMPVDTEENDDSDAFVLCRVMSESV